MKKEHIAEGLTKVTSILTQTASDIGTKTAKSASDNLKMIASKAQQARHEMRMAKLNPLFADEYKDPAFDLPNMIAIVDEDQRKDMPECDGAIGWIDKNADLEVLNLYLEAIPFSGLSFYPPASIGAVYYRDIFDDKHFIDLNNFSSVVQKDRMTELRNIAHALGAKECRLESYESKRTLKSEKRKGSGKVKSLPLKADASGTSSKTQEASEKRSVQFVQTFEGEREPIEPELKWFEHDKEINSLIKLALSDNPPKEYTVKLDSSASCSMSLHLAAKIDASLKKLHMNGDFSMENQVSTEAQQTLMFYIKF